MTKTEAIHHERARRLADQLERGFRGGAWHGPALGEALAEVDAVAAAHRPVPGAHTIWEIVLHATVWIEVARRRILGEEAPAPPAALDWPEPGPVDGATWRQTVRELDRAHARLHAAVRDLKDERLDEPVAGSDPTVRGLLLGVLQHNAYHAGQITLLSKAGRQAGAER